ncbi:MAG: CDP-alcohol phosphatidyltransferase family protein [Anaerolineae bacterium]
MKTIADMLTGMRAILGLWLMWLGWQGGADAVNSASLTLLASWATDVLDGPAARSDPRHLRSWIGDHDLEADMLVALGVVIYLALAGFVSLWLAVVYLIMSAMALRHFGSVHLGWALQAPPYGAMIWTAWRVAPTYGAALVIWIIGVVVVTWPRFPKKVVPEFINGMRALRPRHQHRAERQ